MERRWDTIVIGAGLGGLTAAATLIRAGQNVLVLEKNPHPGGTAYTFTRKGFVFPMGPLGFSTPGRVKQILTDLEADEDFHLHRVHYQVKAFGVDIVLSRSFERLADSIKALFPEDKEGVNRFFRDMTDIVSAMRSSRKSEDNLTLQWTAKTSAAEYLESNIKSRRLRRILGSLGTQEPYSAMALLAAMWNLMSNEGIWYPHGGMHAFCNRIGRAVTEKSDGIEGTGELRTGQEVQGITVGQDTVTGVHLSNGAHEKAPYVISNADFKTTFLRLVPPEILPVSAYRQLAQARQTGSVFQLCLGLKASQVDLSAFSDASRLLYRENGTKTHTLPAPVNWTADEIDPAALAGQELEISLLSKEDPGLAPKEGHVLAIRTEADYGHFSRYRPPAGRRKPTYGPYKRRLAQALTRKVADIIPGLEAAVEALDIATPLTFEDQGGRSEGAVAGWSWDYEDTAVYEPVEIIRTPIRGLFMAGYQAYSNLFMGGVPTAMVSGQKAAEHVLNRAGPSATLQIPGNPVRDNTPP